MPQHRVYDFHTQQLIGEMDEPTFRRYCAALRADHSGVDRGGLYGDEWGFGDRLIYVPDAGIRQR
jgi:hypothetical protein